MNDKVVYLKGSGPVPEPERRETAGRDAIRGSLLKTLKEFRAGKFRAVVVITIDNDDAQTWRISGDFSTGEVVAALEITKIRLITEE